MEDIVEVFFKPIEEIHKEESKWDHDEVCLEQIPDENVLQISPIKKMEYNSDLKNKNSLNEKKLNEMTLDGDKSIELMSIGEDIDMMSKKQTFKTEKAIYQIENLNLLNFLFSYFKKKPELINSTSMGYFSKILHALLNKKFDHVKIKYS